MFCAEIFIPKLGYLAIWSICFINLFIHLISNYRPVVLFGPLADLARELLLKDFPLRFAAPVAEGSALSPTGWYIYCFVLALFQIID